MLVQQTIDQQIMGMDINTTQDIASGYEYRVLEVADDGSMLLGVTLHNISMESATSAPDISPEDQAEMMEALNESFDMLNEASRDLEFRLRVTPKGEILSIDGVEAWLEGYLAAIDKQDTEHGKAAREMAESLLGPDMFKQSWRQAFGYIPEHPVMVGDSWTYTLEMDQGLAMQAVSEYTLLAATDSTYELSVTGSVRSGNEHSDFLLELEQQGVKVDLVMDGVLHGTLTLDRLTGWTLASELSMTADAEMLLSVGEESLTATMQLQSVTRVQ
ncbi:DUF6263 family protein [Spirochaeta africana]|nr:DUF6263 family protein [Spirochaeta africana]